MSDEMWHASADAFGLYVRTQRQLAAMSLRQLAEVAQVSNAYLSQIERGLHRPSLRVISALASALGVPPEELLARAGMPMQDGPSAGSGVDVEMAIRNENRLSEAQKQALISVFRSYLATPDT